MLCNYPHTTKLRNAKRTDDQGNLELLDTEANFDKFRRTPNETILPDRTYVLLQFFHVRLIIPRLHFERHDGLHKRIRLCLSTKIIRYVP